jgi:hypothetical protein
MHIKTFLFLLGVSVLLLTFSQCKKTAIATDTDQQLVSAAKATTGLTYYKNDSTIVHSSPQSAHNAYFRVKYNAIAIAALTDSGKLPVGGTFPEGSLVVKELYNSPTGALLNLAIFKKASGDANAEAGWLWGEYGVDGTVKHGITQKGNGCISCHSADARDYNRVFELFP